jgi:uncharacterized protein (DUF58 family)
MSKIPIEILKKIRKIQIKASKLVAEALSGAYVSSFKGSGVIFDDVREYVLGDEVRNIDWKLTAKMQTPYVKQYQEERELTVYFLVDISSSLLFGSEDQTKFDLLLDLVAAIAFSAVSNNDKVSLVLFDDEVRKYLPPKRGVGHFLRLIREIYVQKKEGKKTNLSKALEFFSRVQKKSCICFIISDFLTPDFSQGLTALSKKHELLAIRLFDKVEEKIPDIGVVRLQDLETKENVWVDTGDENFVEQFQCHVDERKKTYEKQFKKMKMPYLELATDSDLVRALSLFLSVRKKSRA